jgi:hypothetical protein
MQSRSLATALSAGSQQTCHNIIMHHGFYAQKSKPSLIGCSGEYFPSHFNGDQTQTSDFVVYESDSLRLHMVDARVRPWIPWPDLVPWPSVIFGAWVWPQITMCGIGGSQIGTGASVWRSPSVLPCQLLPYQCSIFIYHQGFHSIHKSGPSAKGVTPLI